MEYTIVRADDKHLKHAKSICSLMEEAAKTRGTGIAKRTPEYLQKKMQEGKAIIAIHENQPIGFCYIESWGHDKYVANSGLIVHPTYRKSGLAKAIKEKTFELSQEKYPKAYIFGITTSLAVMKINSDLGYKPVTFSELTDDNEFWKGCQSCTNYDILTRTERKHCLCTGMLAEPQKRDSPNLVEKRKRWENFNRFLRLQKLKTERKFSKKRTKR